MERFMNAVGGKLVASTSTRAWGIRFTLSSLVPRQCRGAEGSGPGEE